TAPSSLTVPAAGLTGVQVQLNPYSAIQVQVTEQGKPIPAKVIFFNQSASGPNYPSSYGEQNQPGGASSMIFARPSGETLPLLAGTYRVVAMRGFEYDLNQQT